MRRTVRGVRALAPEVFAAQRTPEPPSRLAPPRAATAADAVEADDASQARGRDAGAAGRGIVHDDQGGPLPPPGGRLAEAVEEGHASLPRQGEAHKGGRLTSAVPVEQAPWPGG
jgi:hypothetical protein